jgi:myo-inositol catabolism protein IolS
MSNRRLGKSGLYVFPIGLGCRTLGYKSAKEEEAIAIVQRAVELGTNFVDTANIYRKGKSEEIVGKAINSMRNKVVLATKGSIVRTPEGLPTQDLRPESVRQAVKDSLKRLQTDYIDLYQIHYPDPLTPFKETAEVLKELVGTGTIKNVGVSNFSSHELEEWTNLIETPTVQLPYNFLQRELYTKLLPVCQKHDVSMMIYTPLLMGLMSGKLTGNETFAENDERSTIPPSLVKTSISIANQLKPLADKYNKTVAQVIVNFILNQPQVGCVLVGASSLSQVEENVGAAKWTMQAGDRKKIEKTVHGTEESLDKQYFTQQVAETRLNYAGNNVATIEMGLKLVVPHAVKKGDRIKISWNGEYLGCAEES